MSERGLELGTFCSRERCLNRSATAPHYSFTKESIYDTSAIVDFMSQIRIIPDATQP